MLKPSYVLVRCGSGAEALLSWSAASSAVDSVASSAVDSAVDSIAQSVGWDEPDGRLSPCAALSLLLPCPPPQHITCPRDCPSACLPSGAVHCRDRQLRAIVLAIRGTHSFKDMFTSLTGG